MTPHKHKYETLVRGVGLNPPTLRQQMAGVRPISANLRFWGLCGEDLPTPKGLLDYFPFARRPSDESGAEVLVQTKSVVSIRGK